MIDDKITHEYDDIINLPNPTSRKHPRMSVYDRAAQFSPFAALTGHDDAIKETFRLTESRIELDADVLSILNERLNIIREKLELKPVISITYFIPDDRKLGGKFVTKIGIVKRIDEYNHSIVLADKTLIPIDEITEIELI